MSSESFTKPCPCGSQASLDACCGRFLNGFEAAPTPETLMRSRFTAFATGTDAAIAYLVETHHPDFRPPNLESALRKGIGATHWLTLTVRNAGAAGDSGTVDFVATYRHQGQMGEMRESSNFVREKGLWLYMNGS